MGSKVGSLSSAISTPNLPTSSAEAEQAAGEYSLPNGADYSCSLFSVPTSNENLRISRSNTCRVGDDEDIEETDEIESEGVLFYVNKSGFPISEHVYTRMWDFACRKHPSGKQLAVKCQNIENAAEVPIPKEPKHWTIKAPVKTKLKAIQTYMDTLEYNHTGTQFFDIIKNRPVISLMEVCRKMVAESLPIKCLEATLLGIFLTNGVAGLERFPLSFKSVFGNKSARHVVLAVYHNGQYGSLGMSRRTTLAYKSLSFDSLSALVESFEKCYAEIGHKISRLAIGIPVTHDPRSFETIVWGNFIVNGYWKKNKIDVFHEIDKYGKEMRTKMRTSSISITNPNLPMNNANVAAFAHSTLVPPPYNQQLTRPKIANCSSSSVLGGLKKSKSSDHISLSSSLV